MVCAVLLGRVCAARRLDLRERIADAANKSSGPVSVRITAPRAWEDFRTPGTLPTLLVQKVLVRGYEGATNADR